MVEGRGVENSAVWCGVEQSTVECGGGPWSKLQCGGVWTWSGVQYSAMQCGGEWSTLQCGVMTVQCELNSR